MIRSCTLSTITLISRRAIRPSFLCNYDREEEKVSISNLTMQQVVINLPDIYLFTRYLFSPAQGCRSNTERAIAKQFFLFKKLSPVLAKMISAICYCTFLIPKQIICCLPHWGLIHKDDKKNVISACTSGINPKHACP